MAQTDVGRGRRASGFTLVELVVVVVILGVLAAVAIPKFVSLRDDAEQAAIASVAGALTAASATNAAACTVTGQTVSSGKCAAIQTCTDPGVLLNPAIALNSLPSSTAYYTSGGMRMMWNGCSLSCTLYKDKAPGDRAYSADFTLIASAGLPVTAMGCVPLAFGG